MEHKPQVVFEAVLNSTATADTCHVLHERSIASNHEKSHEKRMSFLTSLDFLMRQK
jgi:hypothetical protein